MKDPEFLNAAGLNKETALSIYIPNTYELYWNASANTFRDRMLKEYNAFWTSSRSEKA